MPSIDTVSSRPAAHRAVVAVRYLTACLLATPLLPLLIFLRLPLPDTSITRAIHRAGVLAWAIVTAVADIECTFVAPADCAEVRPDMRMGLRPTLAAVWCSPLPMPATTGRRGPPEKLDTGAAMVVRTYDQPGSWMTDAELKELQRHLKDIAIGSMGMVPTHRIFDEDPRAAFVNRIVSVAFEQGSAAPVGFTAMVYLPFQPGEHVVHLGLTMIKHSHRGRRLQSPLFTKCLVMAMFNLGKLSYCITNIGASPAGIGAVSDYFYNTYPHYLRNTRCSDRHLAIARHVMRNFRHEFACSTEAVFDENTFVVKASNEPTGGGCHEMIKDDNVPVSQHRSDLCNDFCAEMLDLSRGDELFQVGTVEFFFTSLKYLWALKTRAKPAKPRKRSPVRVAQVQTAS